MTTHTLVKYVSKAYTAFSVLLNETLCHQARVSVLKELKEVGQE